MTALALNPYGREATPSASRAPGLAGPPAAPPPAAAGAPFTDSAAERRLDLRADDAAGRLDCEDA